MFKCYELIISEIKNTIKNISTDEIQKLSSLICNHKRIFFSGLGRSGLVAKAFAMRLMHLGFTVFVVGDATTPCICKNDLLVIASGSGETASLVCNAKKANEVRATIASITTNPNSSIAHLSNLVLTIHAQAKSSKTSSSSNQPMGTLFEQVLLLLFDGIAFNIMGNLKKNSQDLFLNHANLE